MKKTRLLMGSALGLAAIAVAIDHTRHKLPDARPPATSQQQGEMSEGNPCGLDSGSPCGADENPCGLD